MKKLVYLLLFLPSVGLAEGPKFKFDDSTIQQEFQNVYQDIRRANTKTIELLEIVNSDYSRSAFKYIGRAAAVFSALVYNVNAVALGFDAYNQSSSWYASSTSAFLLYKGDGYMSIYGNESLTVGSTYSPTVRWKILANGTVTQPYQPSFSAYMSATASDVTGDNSVYVVAYNTEISDVGNNFASNVFTAPVDGTYLLIASIEVEQLSIANHSGLALFLNTSNRTYENQIADVVAGRQTFSISQYCDMDANDEAYVTVAVYGSSKVVDVLGSAALYSRFSGSLIN